MSANELNRTLLLCGAIAGPLYVLVGIAQILVRPGFDVSKHALSLMSNGDLGWIQIANFIVTGALVIAFAIGLRRLLAGSKAGTFGPLLIAIYGIGLIGAEIFSADPALGFPPGTPEEARGIRTGILFFAAFAGIASGSASARAQITIAFYVAVLLVWCWLTVIALKLVHEREPFIG